jgi:sn-glycerol 3-phosphate transport system ATP-binding protein
MSAIELQGVAKRYGETPALEEVSFTAAAGEFLVLLGPSGCGKSTTLRLIAGLETVTRGRILIGGEDITQRPPAQRRLSMVFQSYALFPHLDVAENIQFGLKVRKVPARERAARLAQVAELVGLGALLARKPAQLSGGQRQRVALARAIIAQHPVCLMDEPLSNLDAKLRHEMRIEIRALQRKLGMTVVYVTHDQTEAMSMADKVLLMRDGQVEQEGSPDALYARPRSVFAAGFIGAPPMNIIDPAACGLPAGGLAHAPLPADPAACRVGIRPEAIRLAAAGLPARLLGADYLGADSIVIVRAGEQSIVVRVPGHRRVTDGERTHLSWSADAVHLFDRDSGTRIEV